MSGEKLDDGVRSETRSVEDKKTRKDLDKEEFITRLHREISSAQAPRPLVLRSLSESWKRWVMGLLFPVLFILVFSALMAPNVVSSLAKGFGIPGTARVANHYTTYSKNVPHFHLELAFTDDQGRSQWGRADVVSSFYQSTLDNSSIPIHYLSLVPRWPALDDSPTVDPFGLFFMGGILVIAILAMIYNLWMEHRVMTNGVFVKGTITKVWRGRGASTTVEYELNGEMKKTSQGGAIGLVGDSAAVLVVPDHTWQNRFFTIQRIPFFRVREDF